MSASQARHTGGRKEGGSVDQKMRRPVSKEGRAFYGDEFIRLTTRMVYLGLLSGAPVVAPAAAPNRLCTPLCWVAGNSPQPVGTGSVNQMEAQSGRR